MRYDWSMDWVEGTFTVWGGAIFGKVLDLLGEVGIWLDDLIDEDYL